jgi:hypothetical protein
LIVSTRLKVSQLLVCGSVGLFRRFERLTTMLMLLAQSDIREERESKSERRRPGRHLLGPSIGRPAVTKASFKWCVQVKPFSFVDFVLCDCDVVVFLEVSFFPVRTIMRFLLLFSRQASQAVKRWWVGRGIANANVPRYVRFAGGLSCQCPEWTICWAILAPPEGKKKTI